MILLPPVDVARPAYPGSPSISRTSVTASRDWSPLSNLISQRLCCIDPRYARLFGYLATGSPAFQPPIATTSTSTPLRRQRTCPSNSSAASPPTTLADFVGRVAFYLTNAENLLPLPIGECLVAGAARVAAAAASQFSSSPPEINSPLPMGGGHFGRFLTRISF